MLDRPPPSQNSNTAALRVVAIVVVVVFLLSAVYRWNVRQATEEAEQAVEADGGRKLCEVRANQAGHSEECELIEGEWVPVDSAVSDD